MIVSHRHRFVFVKTRKTAGTSIEVFLSALAGDDAVVTPVNPPEPGHDPRNWHRLFNPLPELTGTAGGGRRRPKAVVRDLKDRRAFFNHMPATLARARLGRARFDGYFTFCFERDPWTKTRSWYHYRTHGMADPPPFERWVLDAPLPSDWFMYSDGDRRLVDFVGRFETLEDDLARVLERLGIDTLVALPRAKGAIAAGRDDVAFSPEANRRIAAVFARELAAFDYPDRSQG